MDCEQFHQDAHLLTSQHRVLRRTGSRRLDPHIDAQTVWLRGLLASLATAGVLGVVTIRDVSARQDSRLDQMDAT